MTDDNEYVPCEMALLEYSIGGGISKIVQEFIEPPKVFPGGVAIPQGCDYEAMKNSKETHHIPVKNFTYANDDYGGIFRKILRFIKRVSIMMILQKLYGQNKEFR